MRIAAISERTDDRIAINLVSGWFSGEFRAIGEPWLDHDARDRRSEEATTVLRGVWAQDDFSVCGDFHRYANHTLKAKPAVTPEIFQGDSSRAARDMAARVSNFGEHIIPWVRALEAARRAEPARAAA